MLSRYIWLIDREGWIIRIWNKYVLVFKCIKFLLRDSEWFEIRCVYNSIYGEIEVECGKEIWLVFFISDVSVV